ncbi:MAG TPA: hypothetical protein VHO25_21920 [Polyangiaceae bacterium]|nr:hypothetical protein [Polyangiaceae bacterium]
MTAFQRDVATELAKNRTPDSYLAGGAALHIEPNSKRYSNDLDYFHDSEERVASAFAADRAALEQTGYTVEIGMNQPGFIRAIVRRGSEATKVEWAHDSAWRFLPPIKHETSGYQLHEVDLAINKVLALAGRDEPRDFLDVLHAHQQILPLGALCWAAAGKDPGFTPSFLLSLLRRKGRYHDEDFARLMLTEKPNLQILKHTWLAALDEAEAFIAARPAEEMGCLYYSRRRKHFVAEMDDTTKPHYGRPGGVLPRIDFD